MLDQVNTELDARKVANIDTTNAIILSISECCGVDMVCPDDKELVCSKCYKPCNGAEEK